MKAVAKQFPKTHFAIVDVSNADEGNAEERRGPALQGAGGRLPRRLRGRARREGATAARRSRRVGGQKQPPVDRYIAGYQAGAKAAFPGVQDAQRLLAGLREPGEVQGGRAQPDRRRLGSSSSRSRAAAASARSTPRRTKSVWGIGVDADQGFLGPHILTSALKGVDTAVFLSIKDAKDGHFKGGQDAVYGLEQNGVGLGKFSPKAPKGIEAKVEQIEQQIIEREDHEHPDDGEVADGHDAGTLTRAAEAPEGAQLRRRRDGRRRRAAADERGLGRHRRRERRLQHDERAREGPQPAREPARQRSASGTTTTRTSYFEVEGPAELDEEGAGEHITSSSQRYEGKEFHTPVDRVIVRVRPTGPRPRDRRREPARHHLDLPGLRCRVGRGVHDRARRRAVQWLAAGARRHRVRRGALAVIVVASAPRSIRSRSPTPRSSSACSCCSSACGGCTRRSFGPAGLKAQHDEAEEFEATQRALSTREHWVASTTAFNGVLLEGVEVVLIVIALGGVGHRVGAVVGAVVALAAVIVLGVALRAPLTRVPGEPDEGERRRDAHVLRFVLRRRGHRRPLVARRRQHRAARRALRDPLRRLLPLLVHPVGCRCPGRSGRGGRDLGARCRRGLARAGGGRRGARRRAARRAGRTPAAGRRSCSSGASCSRSS